LFVSQIFVIYVGFKTNKNIERKADATLHLNPKLTSDLFNKLLRDNSKISYSENTFSEIT